MRLKLRDAACATAIGLICMGTAGALGQDQQGKGVEPELRVEMKAIKLRVKAGEAIRFTVRGNQEFHLYLIGYERKRPRETKSNAGFCWFTLTRHLLSVRIKPDNRRLIVPFNDARLDAESPGIEEFQLIASRDPIALPSELRRCGADGATVPTTEAAPTIPASVVVRTFRIVVEP